MATASSALEPHGIRIEPDGTLTLDRERIAAPSGPEAGYRADHARYDVANSTLAATFENPGRISTYDVFNIGPILEQDTWRQTLAVDGTALSGFPPTTHLRGRAMVEVWEANGCRLRVTSFCGERRNALFQAYEAESLDGQPHSVEVNLRAGFTADEEESAYALHFEERLGAIVAVLGEMCLETEPGPPGESEAVTIPARTAYAGADVRPAEWRVSDQRAYLTYRLQATPGERTSFCLVISGGPDRHNAEEAFRQATGNWREVWAEVDRYGDWLSSRLEIDDPSLHALYAAGVNTAISAYREDYQGRFRGLLPGASEFPEFSATLPADAYWCSQALLPYRPEAVREEILALARAVHADGRLARSVRTVPRRGGTGADAYDRQPDACDSPSYFALLVHDYLCWTGDRALLDVREGDQTVWEKVLACVRHLRDLDTNHDMLFEKRPSQPDWAFDVLRDDWVTYDLALHCQALKSVAEIALMRGEEATGRDLATWATRAQGAINQVLWNAGQGYYVDYIRSYQGFVEDHAAIDTVLAVLYGIGSESQSHRHLEHLERTLETRHNNRQYYGDWGVMSCYPFYKNRSDLIGRSAWAYSFHNGAAWPGWSGIYALAEFVHDRPGWRYALERWWTYGLAQYWFTPTEHYAPPYDAPSVRRGTALYAWSAMPAAAMVLGGFGFWPNLAGEMVLRVPPWGDSRLNGIRFRGETYDVEAQSDVVTVYRNGREIASSPRGLRIRLQEPVITQMA